MRRGFTLLELCFVLAVMAGLAALTVPSYQAVLRRAQAAEAGAMVEAMAHAELRALRDRGAFVPCPASGGVPTHPVPFVQAPCWQQLGFAPTGLVRYRYAVDVTGGSFQVRAEGDLDGDGQTSLFTLNGATMVLQVQDELE